MSPQNPSSQAAPKNNLEQHSSRLDNHAARVPIKNSTDWEEPDFEEIDVCMEITAYVYHWQ